MKKIFLLVFVTIGCIMTSMAQAPSIEWQKCLGGSDYDNGMVIKHTTDGGYIVLGESNSNDADVSGNHGGIWGFGDIWIVKLSNVGSIQWQKCLGGTRGEGAHSIQQTIDGGYIIVGVSNSDNGDLTNHYGDSATFDMWIVRLNSIGDIEWQKDYGGTNTENVAFIQQTLDRGYIITGSSASNDGDVTGNHGKGDMWIVKLNSTGSIQWQKTLGGTKNDYASSAQQTSDGGLIVVGTSSSNDGDVSENHGGTDIWVVKTNASGIIEWQKSLGGSNDDYGNYIRQTIDGGYIIGGESLSNDGNVSGNHGEADMWVVKLNNTGSIEWQKSFGGTGYDYGNNIEQVLDGGYIICTSTPSNDGDVIGNHGGYDVWLVKLNNTGTIQWQKLLGGNGNDYGGNILQTPDGGYTIVGLSESNDGDVSNNHGGSDMWVVRLSGTPTGIKENSNNIPFSVYPNPSKGIITLQSEDISWVGNKIKIFNSIGQEVYQTTILQSKMDIDTKLLGGSGVYIINEVKPDGTILNTQKIIVQ